MTGIIRRPGSQTSLPGPIRKRQHPQRRTDRQVRNGQAHHTRFRASTTSRTPKTQTRRRLPPTPPPTTAQIPQPSSSRDKVARAQNAHASEQSPLRQLRLSRPQAEARRQANLDSPEEANTTGSTPIPRPAREKAQVSRPIQFALVDRVVGPPCQSLSISQFA